VAKRKAGGGVQIVVTGVDKVDRRLRKLGPAIQKKVVRSAMRKAVSAMRRFCMSGVSRHSGSSAASVQRMLVAPSRTWRRWASRK